MFSCEMIDKIDQFLHKNFNIIFDFEFNGLLLLWGGAIKSILMDLPIRDFDFVLLTQEDDNILEFIKKYNLEYEMKSDFVYSFIYNGYEIDISYKNDLHNYGYNTDLIFYDIHRKQIIPFGIKQAINKRMIIDYNYIGYPRKEKRIHNKNRLRKAKKFIQFMNNDKKRVRVVKKNNYYRKMFIGFLKNPGKIFKLFRG